MTNIVKKKRIPGITVALNSDERALVLQILEKTQVVGTSGMRIILSLRDKLSKGLPDKWQEAEETG